MVCGVCVVDSGALLLFYSKVIEKNICSTLLLLVWCIVYGSGLRAYV
jgi:hypothetical protein